MDMFWILTLIIHLQVIDVSCKHRAEAACEVTCETDQPVKTVQSLPSCLTSLKMSLIPSEGNFNRTYDHFIVYDITTINWTRFEI